MRAIKSQKLQFKPINPQHCEHVATYYALECAEFAEVNRDDCLDNYSAEFELGYTLHMLTDLHTALARGELYSD